MAARHRPRMDVFAHELPTSKPASFDPRTALQALARNLYWSWHPQAAAVFEALDPALWEQTEHNPVALLQALGDDAVRAHAERDPSWLSELGRVHDAFVDYLAGSGREDIVRPEAPVAYFSAEFGLARCLPIYSGGLGILAGDHLKSASDLRLPLVGVGLFYRRGYFRQALGADGAQTERYPPYDPAACPMEAVSRDGAPVRVRVPFPGREVSLGVWRVDVGRVPLYLLDADVPENSPDDRRLTDALYGGDAELRIQQLMLLGIGGYRALSALGQAPAVCHMNEGHAGFLAVERARQAMAAHGISYSEAALLTARGNIFTTHTPVPAGFDVFPRALVDKYLAPFLGSMDMSLDRFMSLGRAGAAVSDPSDAPFNMAALALRHAATVNGVSRLHGQVSRRMAQAQGAFGGWLEDEVPVTSVTNGIHTLSWLAPSMQALYGEAMGPNWSEALARPEAWRRQAASVSGDALWKTHEALRASLCEYVGAKHSEARLRPEALTIGFARRFATYKRAALMFQDPERLAALVNDAERPVQILIAGKAHPKDEPGKRLIQDIIQMTRRPEFAGRVVFLDDYDIDMARYLVAGVDVWLNNPERPQEASGTSGMKVAVNGGLNCSILDGWWDEGFEPDVGWAFGEGIDYAPGRDGPEAEALYRVLESGVVPTFYDRDAAGCPARWVAMMHAAVAKLGGPFSSDRMVCEYSERLYAPAAVAYLELEGLGRGVWAEASEIRRRYRKLWPQVSVRDVRIEPETEGGAPVLRVQAKVDRGALPASALRVDWMERTADGRHVARPMTSDGDGMYSGCFPRAGAGQGGVRVTPRSGLLKSPSELALTCWG